MFSRHQVSAAITCRYLALLAVACAALPPARSQGTGPFADRAPNSIHSAVEATQNMPAPEGTSPQLQSVAAAGPGFAALDAETQGDLLMIHQQYVAAVDAYRHAPQTSAVVWNKLGIAYQHMYAMDAAKLQYEKALSIDPKYAEAINNLGTVYYGQRNYRRAERCYRKAIHLKPKTASFYSNLGTAYFAEHKYNDGAEAYQTAFALDPDVFIRESLQRIAEMGPIQEQARLNYTLAEIYAQAGNLKAALTYLRAALSEGFGDHKKLMADKDLAALRETPEFQVLMAEQHIN